VTRLHHAAQTTLPADGTTGTLIGRVWRADQDGPSVVRIDDDGVYDISRSFPLVSVLCEENDPAAAARQVKGERLGSLDDILAGGAQGGAGLSFLAPIDLQAIKAAGVTFILSLLERVIEEQARGEPARADAIRADILASVGRDLSGLKPGSPEAAAL